jgi:hypothetical protein
VNQKKVYKHWCGESNGCDSYNKKSLSAIDFGNNKTNHKSNTFLVGSLTFEMRLAILFYISGFDFPH